MARYYEVNENLSIWNMNECEERYFIAMLETAKPFVTPGSRWWDELDSHFYINGGGLSVVSLDGLNGTLKRRDLPEFVLTETNMDDYGRDRDRSMKAHQRALWRDQYRQSDEEERRYWIDQAQREIADLEPPHRTFAEYRRDHETSRAVLAAQEQERRAMALRRSQAESSTKRPTLTLKTPNQQQAEREWDYMVETFTRQAKVALRLNNQDLLTKLVQKISPPNALSMAERIDDPELATVLLIRSMEEE